MHEVCRDIRKGERDIMKIKIEVNGRVRIEFGWMHIIFVGICLFIGFCLLVGSVLSL